MMKRSLSAVFFATRLHEGFFGLVHFKKLQSSGRAEIQIQIKMSALEFVLARDLQR